MANLKNLIVQGASRFIGDTVGKKFIVNGATSSHFLKGDGSLDSNTYLTSASVSGKEDTSNKVTNISASSTDAQYPSAKCMFDVCSFISGNVITAYDSLTGLPKLDSSNSATLSTNSSEYISGTIKLHKISKTGKYSDLIGVPTTGTSAQFVKGDGSLDSNEYSTTAHTHGNITAAGALQTTDVAIANGDKLVVTDASNSNKVARTSVSFDGSTTTKALTQKGSFESFQVPLVSGTNIKTINGISVLGSGNITVSGGSGGESSAYVIPVTGSPLGSAPSGSYAGISGALSEGRRVFMEITNFNGDDDVIYLPLVQDYTETDGVYYFSTVVSSVLVTMELNSDDGVTDSTYNAGSHAHGNITNAGALQATDVTIANGDKLVVTDASNSNKVARTSVSFDGSTTTQALTKKGTFETFLNGVAISTDNAVVRFDGTTGAIQNSGVIINDERHVIAARLVTSGATAYQFVKGDGSLDSNEYSTTAHTHGNITAAGALQSTDVGIASGDKLVVTDASNSNKVARTSVSFDGSTTTQALTKKGTFESFQATLVSGTNIKTINGETILGSGNITISGGGVTSVNGYTGAVSIPTPPAVTSSDNDKILQVVNGSWSAVAAPVIYSGTVTPSSSLGKNGDIYIKTS